MKKTTFVLILILFSFSTARADVFQLFATERRIRAVAAAVQHNGKHIGYTNHQGMIVINHPRGLNTFTVTYGSKTTEIKFNITGNQYIQPVYLP